MSRGKKEVIKYDLYMIHEESNKEVNLTYLFRVEEHGAMASLL